MAKTFDTMLADLQTYGLIEVELERRDEFIEFCNVRDTHPCGGAFLIDKNSQIFYVS